jgi:hypothetical protein
MADGPVKTMGSGCLGGLLGAILGILIGGFIGPVIATSGNVNLRSQNDPMAKNVSSMFDACGSVVGLVLGSGIGASSAGLVGRSSVPGSLQELKAWKRRKILPWKTLDLPMC